MLLAFLFRVVVSFIRNVAAILYFGHAVISRTAIRATVLFHGALLFALRAGDRGGAIILVASFCLYRYLLDRHASRLLQLGTVVMTFLSHSLL